MAQEILDDTVTIEDSGFSKIDSSISVNNQDILTELYNYPFIIDLPYAKSTHHQSSQKIAFPVYTLQQQLYSRLKYFSQETGYTISAFLKVVWANLISHYSNQERLAICCFLDDSIVYFHDNSHTVIEALKCTKQNSLRVVDLPADISSKFSFSVAFEYVDHKKSKDRVLHAQEPNELLLTCHENNNLVIQIIATNDLFADLLLQQLYKHFENAVDSLLSRPNTPLKEISCLTSAEQKKILYEFNDNGQIAPANKTILACFEEQVAKTPYAVAVIFENQQLTYLELNERANQWARCIRQKYLELTQQSFLPDTLIAMYVERSLEMVIGILAILKAGGAYVPMDPAYPEDRVAFILQDTESKIILTHRHLQDKLKALDANILSIALDDEITVQEKSNLPNQLHPNHLAYVIYTSGTTGMPKGVLQTHANVTRLFRETELCYQFNHQDVWTLFHSYAFDFSVWELWGALLYGGKLIIPNHSETRDTRSFHDLCHKHQVTVLNQTPTAFYQFIEEAREHEKLHYLRYVIFGGEALNIQQLQSWWSQYGEKQPSLVNMYGITETTVHVTYKKLSMDDVTKGSNIGRPIRDLKAYVLDKNFEPVPLGIIGELYVGGAGLARGYLNRPELTQERFIDNPFVTEADRVNNYTRLYKTGDLVRWEADGSLEYLGRNDHQVKLRGYRIELGEIEAILNRFPGVKQGVVLLQESGGNPYLIGYYVAEAGVCEIAIREHLHEYLPSYMVPSILLRLDALPMTVNGKLDKKALPLPQLNAKPDDLGARNEVEAALCQIWKEVLGFKQVGIQSSFFYLGGHSLHIMQLVLKIRKNFKKIISPAEIFRYQTIEQQAALISERACVTEEHVVFSRYPRQCFEPFPLTDIQRAYLFGRTNIFALGGIKSHIYIENEQEGIDVVRLENALNSLIARHEMLRAVILDDGTQKIVADFPYYKIQSHQGNVSTVREAIIKKFRDSNPFPLFEVRVTSLQENRFIVHFYFDLLIADGTGLEVIFRELSCLYEHPEKKLSAPKVSYRDAILAIEHKGVAFENAKAYWLARIDSMPDTPELPTQLLSKDDSPAFIRRKGSLTASEWLAFKKRAAESNVTPAALLLTMYGEILKVWSKSPKFTLNVMFFNRPRVHPDIDRVVGNFSSTLLLEMNLQGQDSYEDKARKVQNQLLQDLEHSEFNGIKVLNELNRRQGGSSVAAMPVVFACALNLSSPDDQVHPKRFKWYGAGVSYSHLETPQVWFDHQVFEDDDGSFCFFWDVRERYFPEGIIEKMFNEYQRALQEMAQGVSTPLALLPYHDLRLIQTVNKTTMPINSACLHVEVFKQAKETPDKVALLTSKRSLSYREMAATACSLAARLAVYPIAPNDTVVILMEKGWEQIVAALAIQAAGAAYIPVDSALPEERIRQILTVSGCKAVISQKALDFHLDIPVLLLNEVQHADSFLEMPIAMQQPHDLAYIIFTSGSTGIPKGVMITHQAAFNTIAAINHKYKVTADDRVFAISSFSFDLSVFDVFGLLHAGGSLYIPTGEELKSPDCWLQNILEHKVTIWNSAPALMQVLMECVEQESPAENRLRLVLMSGDWIPVQLPGRISTHFKAEVISLGGATEASIWSNDYPIKHVESTWISIPYGKPLPNQTMYVLDDDLKLRAVWATGMIYIGGLGLAKGYLGDADKTAKSFIWHPEMNELLYRTGDLGRIGPDGNIEFLGRDDLQVKVQGYRIELEEIESIIARIPDVDQSVVRIIGEKNEAKQIIAFFTSKKTIAISIIKKCLSEKLPHYMIPNQILQIKSFPLTTNGKVDGKMLVSLLGQSNEKKSRLYMEPQGLCEQKMAKIWETLLNVPKVGRSDNFFDLGGTSFLAFQMIYQVQKELGLSLSLSTLFQKGSISELLEIESSKESSLIILQPEGEKLPFFFVHPSGGGVLCYSELMQHLGTQHPFYGFQSPGYMENQPLLPTVEEMAEYYLKLLLQKRPHGDFWLGGWSFGGNVAFEMACQLNKMGRSIKPLLLIDSPAPLMREMPDQQTLYAWFKADYGSHYSLLDEQSKDTLFRVFRNNIAALASYNPDKMPIDLIQLKAQDIHLEQLKIHAAGAHDDWGWHNFSTGHIRSCLFDADHTSIIQQPQVVALASSIRTFINEDMD